MGRYVVGDGTSVDLRVTSGGEDDFYLKTVPGTCGELFFHFRQPPRNRHPYLFDDYTVLTQQRIKARKRYCHVFSLNVKRKRMYRKHQGWSRIVSNPSRFLQTCQQTNRGGHNRITLMYAHAKNKNRLKKSMETSKRRVKRLGCLTKNVPYC